MGSNAKYLVDEDLCCPVCKKPLSSPGSPPKPKINKIGRGRGRAPHLHSYIQAQRDTRMAIGKFKDTEDIVVAQCGHLFHKFCLRHYCYLVREGRSNHMYKVCCPCCDRHISMSSQTVDYRSHQDKPNDIDKDFTKTSIMNNELSGQVVTVQQKLQRVAASIEDGSHNFEIYRSHWRQLRKELKSIKAKRIEIESLYSEIERSEQMLKCMQNQQLKIVRKFITKVKEKPPKNFIHFPRRLSPFLQIIKEDDRLVRDLGEIIVPIHLNHLKSDRQSLLKGIIATVHEKMVAQGKTIEMPPAETPEQQSRNIPTTLPKKPAIFVKVRKSSISILSSASLTRESIQKIIQTVDIPLQRSRKSSRSGKATTKKKVRLVNKALEDSKEDTKVDLAASASDIKILYMPKRKMVEHSSEPCRTIDENESSANVPARKCKSTDAVLVKTKKNEKGSLTVSKPMDKSTMNEKRSSTATVISMSKNSENVEYTTAPKNVSCPPTVNIDEQDINVTSIKVKPCTNNQEGVKKKVVPVTIDSDLTNVTCKTEQEDSEQEIPEVFKKSDTVPPTSPTEAPNETASLLKLIYDNLEEERKSTHNLKSRSRGSADWGHFDENNNELLKDITGTGIFSRGSRNAGSGSQGTTPRPQFFRVDGRGIARPESPHSIKFRQPTFLYQSENTNASEKSFIDACLQPDEENQMDALTSEEKCRILSEHEAFLNSRRNCGAHARRPMFHGVPACLGMNDGHIHLGTPPDPQSIPFYLKKWQQQLATSRKVLKAMPRIRSTRLVNTPKSDRIARCHYNSTYAHPHANSSYLRQEEMAKLSPSVSIHLPPLSMYPVKRPTTAQCDNVQHREGPEREISRLYNYDSVWK